MTPRGVGVVLGALGAICAVVGIFVSEGISIGFPGIILGAPGYSASRAKTGRAKFWALLRRCSM
jgi:hypothetical protein